MILSLKPHEQCNVSCMRQGKRKAQKYLCIHHKKSPIESFLGSEGGILLWYHFPYDAMYC